MQISDFKTRVESKLHGTTLDQVQDVYNLIYEAAGNILLLVDPIETKRIVQINNAIYDRVYDYICPTDLKGNRWIDLQPQTPRAKSDKPSATYDQNFDLNKTNQDVNIRFNSGVKTIRISKSLSPGNVLNDCNTLTSNGSWVSTGGATNVAADAFNYIAGSGSIKFDIPAAGSASGISNTTETSLDLSTYKDTGSLFAWVYIPNTTAITSVTLRWGSSTSNYYSVTATTTQDNTAFVIGWNLVRFDWYSLTPTGTPVDTAITYTAVLFNYNGTAVPSCRVDSIMAKLGSIYNIVYYSKYLFRNSSGTWIEAPSADTDYINLDTESFNILLYEVAYLVSQEVQGRDGGSDYQFFRDERDKLIKQYSQTYKSETKKPRESYYRANNLRRR